MRGLFQPKYGIGIRCSSPHVGRGVLFSLETLFKSERVMEAIFHCFFENYISKSSSDHWKSVVDVLGEKNTLNLK